MIKTILTVFGSSLLLIGTLWLPAGSAGAHKDGPAGDHPNSDHCPSVACW